MNAFVIDKSKQKEYKKVLKNLASKELPKEERVNFTPVTDAMGMPLVEEKIHELGHRAFIIHSPKQLEEIVYTDNTLVESVVKTKLQNDIGKRLAENEIVYGTVRLLVNPANNLGKFNVVHIVNQENYNLEGVSRLHKDVDHILDLTMTSTKGTIEKFTRIHKELSKIVSDPKSLLYTNRLDDVQKEYEALYGTFGNIRDFAKDEVDVKSFMIRYNNNNHYFFKIGNSYRVFNLNGNSPYFSNVALLRHPFSENNPVKILNHLKYGNYIDTDSEVIEKRIEAYEYEKIFENRDQINDEVGKKILAHKEVSFVERVKYIANSPLFVDDVRHQELKDISRTRTLPKDLSMIKDVFPNISGSPIVDMLLADFKNHKKRNVYAEVGKDNYGGEN